MSEVILLPLFLLLIVVAVISIIWTYSRADDLLDRWASSNGYQLLHKEQRSLRTGPYFWRHSRGQLVYYVTITDHSGERRSAYVRLGGWWMGLWSEDVDVTWDV